MSTAVCTLNDDKESRKCTKIFKPEDIFIRPDNPYASHLDSLLPNNVKDFVYQLKSQEHLKQTAALLNDYMQNMSTQDDEMPPNLTDDQKRVWKLKRKLKQRKK